MMGNRGGALHDESQQLGRRRWVSRQWICCLTSFRGRRREVMAPRRYTELFFLDEAIALAAGHRPCFECRHADAVSFAELWSAARGLSTTARAAEIDRVLHEERLMPDGTKRLHRLDVSLVPDGAMVLPTGTAQPHLVVGASLLPWSFAGYRPPVRRPRLGTVQTVTPPSIIAALISGFLPILHESALISG